MNLNIIDEKDLALVKNYLRVDHDLDDLEISIFFQSAKSYVAKYIGAVDEDELTDVDLIIPILNLTSHFYEYRDTNVLANESIDNILKDILSLNRLEVL